MQPAAGGLGDSGIAVRNLRMEDKSGVNEQGFWKRKVEEVPVDQVRFSMFSSLPVINANAWFDSSSSINSSWGN
jgi:hypothetical protein